MKTYKIIYTVTEIFRSENDQNVLVHINEMTKKFPDLTVDFRSRDISYELEHPFIPFQKQNQKSNHS